MWRAVSVGAVILALAALCPAGRAQEVPVVIEFVPASGLIDVAPELTEIRVTFDRAMSSDYSLDEDDPLFPPIVGTPRWVNLETFAAKVKLQPGRAYRICINPHRRHGFRTKLRVAAEETEWWFRTAGDAGITDEERKANLRAWAELREAIDTRYSYRDLRGIDWDERFEQYEEAAAGAASPADWAAVAAGALWAARDMHMWLTYKGDAVYPFRRKAQRNWNDDAIRRAFPTAGEFNSAFAVGLSTDNIGYISVSNLSTDRKRDFDSFEKVLDAVRDTRALVIDLRANGGGGEPLGEVVARSFIDKEVVYAKHAYRQASAAGGFGGVQSRRIKPAPPERRYGKPVVVLTGPTIMSSAEALVLMLRAGGAALVGAPTYGSSGNPKPTKLSSGVTVFLPSWKAMHPDETCFEGVGIIPDVIVGPPEDAFRVVDPVLNKALEILSEKAP